MFYTYIELCTIFKADVCLKHNIFNVYIKLQAITLYCFRVTFTKITNYDTVHM